ncbi:MAG: hypothetical protein K0Q95_1182 [Bacteroidota bacterium]|jgi:hypothetical protein|nr:hypothetical protein [Bacteroidota bacterium]
MAHKFHGYPQEIFIQPYRQRCDTGKEIQISKRLPLEVFFYAK